VSVHFTQPLPTTRWAQVLAEVRRLEAGRAAAMRELTLAKARELQVVTEFRDANRRMGALDSCIVLGFLPWGANLSAAIT
jgi:hypothetical protein